MRSEIMKPNAKRIKNHSPQSILKMIAKLTGAGNIKVANKQCNIGFNGVSANDINYNNSSAGA